MAFQETNAPSSGVFNAIKGALGLFSNINKANGVTENQNPLPLEEYESSYSELEIIALINQWKRLYSPYYNEIEPSQKLSFEYWIGKQRVDEAQAIQGSTGLVDNKIFQAIETFIPIATRANPDPLVQTDDSELGQQIAHALKQALVHEADRQKLRKIMKRFIRDWTIYRLGILKISYNIDLEQIETVVVNPKRMLFDPSGHWNESGRFTGEWVGEKKQLTAGRLIEMFPRKADKIKDKAKNKMGTKLEFIEWWYRGRDIFFTMDDTVLGKYKNPHWNWDVPEQPAIPAEQSEDGLDHPHIPAIPGQNHWDEPYNPYVGLSIFSTGLQPHDETGLVLQNVGIQDMINRRYRQIDENVRGMNNGMIVNEKFTAEQASQAAAALKRGVAIRYPGLNVQEAAMRFPPGNLPEVVFKTLEDGRNELENIFGTAGSTPQGVESQQTVRGKILINQLDASRIGGGITEYLEQCIDTLYNNWVQLMFVHFTDEHYIVDSGAVGGSQLISIKNTDLASVKALSITVKEGSLIPKDPMTQRNEAIDLWSAGAIDPISFYKKLDFPDPTNAATQLITWQMVQKGQLPPQAYIPTFGQAMPGAMSGALPPLPSVGGPAVNPIGPQTPPLNTPGPGSAPAVSQEGQQLIREIPLPRQ